MYYDEYGKSLSIGSWHAGAQETELIFGSRHPIRPAPLLSLSPLSGAGTRGRAGL